MWHHRHRFESFGEQSRMVDEFDYVLPYGWLGRLTHAAFVARDLAAIFEFRAQAVERLL